MMSHSGLPFSRRFLHSKDPAAASVDITDCSVGSIRLLYRLLQIQDVIGGSKPSNQARNHP